MAKKKRNHKKDRSSSDDCQAEFGAFSICFFGNMKIGAHFYFFCAEKIIHRSINFFFDHEKIFYFVVKKQYFLINSDYFFAAQKNLGRTCTGNQLGQRIQSSV